ncbi:MAG: polyprenyl synthetase family protein [Oscillospiraceae bacterium]|nr:polyprenyl synthetase family protein [Oscillospiraceae bacterium]
MDDRAFSARYEAYRAAVEGYLNGLFTAEPPWKSLYEAMRYSLLSGGKRVRPVLTLECARLGGLADWRGALPFACALELVHTYSLIHDDLPCMDDDATRRGKPTNHVVYGTALATLAGDALQAEAYRLIADAPHISDAAKTTATRALARASGADGMVAGQALDLAGYGHDRATLSELCAKKTGAMLRAAAELGCAAAGAPEALTAALCAYAAHLGLAFQLRDDLLDAGEDKPTFVSILGADGCASEVARLTDAAVATLNGIDGSELLVWLAQTLAARES